MRDIVIADAQPLSRSGLAHILRDEGGFYVVAIVKSSAELYRHLASGVRSVVLLGDHPRNAFGLQTIIKLRTEYPDCPIMAISNHIEAETVLPAVRAGVAAFLTKDCSVDEIVEAAQAVATGQQFFCKTVLQVMTDSSTSDASCDGVSLSPREREIARLVAMGQTNQQIADALFISVHTVRTHRKNLMRKLDCHSASGLTRYALKTGILSP